MPTSDILIFYYAIITKGVIFHEEAINSTGNRSMARLSH